MVIFLGLAHGLVVLPIVYATIPFKKHWSDEKMLAEARNRGPWNTGVAGERGIAPTKIAINPSPEYDRRRFQYFQNQQQQKQMTNSSLNTNGGGGELMSRHHPSATTDHPGFRNGGGNVPRS